MLLLEYLVMSFQNAFFNSKIHLMSQIHTFEEAEMVSAYATREIMEQFSHLYVKSHRICQNLVKSTKIAYSVNQNCLLFNQDCLQKQPRLLTAAPKKIFPITVSHTVKTLYFQTDPQTCNCMQSINRHPPQICRLLWQTEHQTHNLTFEGN